MTEPNIYDIGDVVDLFGTFTDPDTGLPVSPGAVACTVRPPIGSSLRGADVTPSAALVQGHTGEYMAQVAPDTAGTWWYAFDGTSGQQASGERFFLVRERQVAR